MNDTPAADSGVIDRLNAYLDGELTPEERTSVEQSLAADTRLQSEFQRLQRAWDLLDALPRADVGAAFTQSTVEMVAFDAAEELSTAAAAPQRSLVDKCLLAGGVLAAAIGGFLLVDSLRTRPDDALLRDLPVIQNVDSLGRTEPGENAEFFRMLRDNRLPPPPNTDNAARTR